MNSRLGRFVVAAVAVLVPLAIASTPAFAQQAADGQDQLRQGQPQSLQTPSQAPAQAPTAMSGIRLGLKGDSLFDASHSATFLGDSAPASHHEGIGIGVKGGPVFASISQAQSAGVTLKNNNGFLFGLFLGGNRPGAVGVMAEIDYAKKGAKDSSGNALSLYYVEIPVLLRINIGSSSLNGVSFYIIGGPAFAIQLKGSLNGVDVKSQYQTLDINYIIGAGVEITRFILEGRVDNGLRNVNKGNLAMTSTIHNRAFELLFGFRFN
jgi:hypothetical protein